MQELFLGARCTFDVVVALLLMLLLLLLFEVERGRGLKSGSGVLVPDLEKYRHKIYIAEYIFQITNINRSQDSCTQAKTEWFIPCAG